MRLNAFFPTNDIGDDPAKIRDWAQAAEDLGYAMIEVPDHVLGTAARDGWTPFYDESHDFHETFTTLAFLAGCTRSIGLSSGVLVLPQRQTALVAKQAAEVDLLSGGRLRLGIGGGWNHVEYEALDMDWSTRGARQAEQVEVMRRLWTEDLVTVDGRFHRMRAVNVRPRPVQRPIPVWFGGTSDAVLKRAARIGDGWMPIIPPDEKAEARLAELDGLLKENGRDRVSFGLEAWIAAKEDQPERWAAAAAGWRRLGADMAMLFPAWRIPSADGQIAALRMFREALAD
ncbi:LLM class F420-dependent oxidoreductase [Marinibaculum pumilum]|uniref:LLM class F420-dependent oxidoreductase n=1 Tax=Marinibaculum pumilum TaxID=1766165 RepID=A0ABV7L5L4_9PROT